MGELEPVGQHKIKILPRKDDYTFRCACGATHPEPPRGAVLKTRLSAVDQGEKHLSEMRRVRGLMHGKNVTLEAEYQHCQTMATSPDTPPEQVPMWEQLAKELGHRLGYEAPPSVQEELFPLMGTD